MSELSLENQNKELQSQLQELKRGEMVTTETVTEMNQRLIRCDHERTSQQKDYDRKLADVKAKLESKQHYCKRLSDKWGSVRLALESLKVKFEEQSKELYQLKLKHMTEEYSLKESENSCEAVKQRTKELAKEIQLSKCKYDEAMRSLMMEKNMDRLFIETKDELLERQEARFKKLDEEVAKLKETVKTLATSLKRKVAEFKSEAELNKVAIKHERMKNAKLKLWVQELEEKEQELSKKTCKYCGL